MTDLLAYHVARDQMSDLRRTAGQTRLTSTSNRHRSLTNSHRVISRALTRISTAFTVDHQAASGASHVRPITPEAPNGPAQQTR
jgi:hypothetical protein